MEGILALKNGGGGRASRGRNEPGKGVARAMDQKKHATFLFTANLRSDKASSSKGPELTSHPASAVAPEALQLLQLRCATGEPADSAAPWLGLEEASPYHLTMYHVADRSSWPDLFMAESARTKNPLGGEFCFWPKILKVKYATL